MNTSIDGFYAVYLAGSSGQGLAMVVLSDGHIAGADAEGVRLDGDYAIDGGEHFHVTLRLNTPPNLRLINGGRSGPGGEETRFEFDLTPDFSSRPFIRIDSPRGAVNARFVKVRDLVD